MCWSDSQFIIIEQSMEWESPPLLYHLHWLRETIRNRGPRDIVEDTEALWSTREASLSDLQHQYITCRGAHAGQRFDSFEVKTGVREGCLLSAFLFLLVFGWIIRTSTSGKNNVIQWTLLKQFNNLGFVDGLGLLSHNYSQMQEKNKALKQQHQQEQYLSSPWRK